MIADGTQLRTDCGEADCYYQGRLKLRLAVKAEDTVGYNTDRTTAVPAAQCHGNSSDGYRQRSQSSPAASWPLLLGRWAEADSGSKYY